MATTTQPEKPASPAANVPPDVERLFQGSLFLLVATGFITLASTGKLGLISVVFTSGALLLRGYLFFARRELQIEEHWTSYLGLVYIAVYLADFFFLTSDFVTASVHLVLFGMVVKLFSVRRERDHLYLAILAFLEVLSAAVLTVDTVFLISFTVFALIAVVTFMTMEMRRSAIATTSLARNVAAPNRGRNLLQFAILKIGLAILAGIAVFGTGIFFVLPRLSYGYLSKLTQQNTLVTGFSDNVTLGQIGRIQQSEQVAMHVKVEGDTGGTYNFRLRGTTLVNFDGKRWMNPPHSLALLQTSVAGVIDLERLERNFSGAVLPASRARRRQIVRYRVMMEPLGTNVLFLISRPLGVVGRFRELAIDTDKTVQNLDGGRTAAEYGGYSDMSEATNEMAGDGPVPPGMERYLQVPTPIDARLPRLAHQIADPLPTPYEKAAAMERYLSTKYAYTLELGSEAHNDPLANFLFERKRGHCEYFASALAVMLREVGVPTRIVTGFRGGEFNSITGSYIVRARDAHSWVEAYLPGAGWTSFDPTPSSTPITISGWRRAELYLDALREFWREWVINYDVGHQETLAASAVVKSRSAVDDLRARVSRGYDGIMRWARRTNAGFENDPKAAGAKMVLAAAVLMFVINLRTLAALLRRMRIARDPRAAPKSAASIWYERMLQLASRRGFPKTSTQTPAEFASSIDDPTLRNAVQKFTAHFERARYSNSAEDAELLPEILRGMGSTQKADSLQQLKK